MMLRTKIQEIPIYHDNKRVTCMKFLRQLLCILTIVTSIPNTHASQNQYTLNQERLKNIDNVINQAINNEELPGAVVLIGQHNKIVYEKAFGNRALEPYIEPMTLDTIFDIASLTKIFTASAIVQLAERGLIRINVPVSTYIPEFGKNEKEKITIEQLLVHSSGLIADNPEEDYMFGYEKAFENIYNLAPLQEPGTKFIYSDVNYIVLGELIKKISGQTLDTYIQENILNKLTMHETMFVPEESLYPRIAPTEYRDNTIIRGQVHDPRAYLLSGIAGHAGLFSTARDLAKFCFLFLDNKNTQESHVLSNLAIQRMIKAHAITPTQSRGLGWDIDTQFSSYRGDFFANTFGHTGFTGTSIVIDPASKIFIIILSNRVHPNRTGNVVSLRAKIANIVASALS